MVLYRILVAASSALDLDKFIAGSVEEQVTIADGMSKYFRSLAAEGCYPFGPMDTEFESSLSCKHSAMNLLPNGALFQNELYTGFHI